MPGKPRKKPAKGYYPVSEMKPPAMRAPMPTGLKYKQRMERTERDLERMHVEERSRITLMEGQMRVAGVPEHDIARLKFKLLGVIHKGRMDVLERIAKDSMRDGKATVNIETYELQAIGRDETQSVLNEMTDLIERHSAEAGTRRQELDERKIVGRRIELENAEEELDNTEAARKAVDFAYGISLYKGEEPSVDEGQSGKKAKKKKEDPGDYRYG